MDNPEAKVPIPFVPKDDGLPHWREEQPGETEEEAAYWDNLAHAKSLAMHRLKSRPSPESLRNAEPSDRTPQ